jgi:mono/diheme cytochrome c family protein
MKKIRNITLILSLVIFTLYSFKSITQDEWIVPKKYQNMKNPTNVNDKENLSIGKSLYSKHCKSCHGKEGYGDGSKAAEQEGDLGDFSSDDTQSQSDGALFYKITAGREDMPKFDKKLPDDEDRWLIVNYMRTLKE